MATSRVREVYSSLELTQNLCPGVGPNHRSPLFWATAEYMKQVTAIVQTRPSTHCNDYLYIKLFKHYMYVCMYVFIYMYILFDKMQFSMLL